MSTSSGDTILAAENHKRLSTNFWAMVGDGAFFNAGLAFFEVSTVLPVFVAHFTSSQLLIGSVAALKTGGWYLPQLPTALALRGRQRIKGFFLSQAVVGRLAMAALVPLVLAGHWMPEVWILGLFFLCYAVFAFTEGAATLAWLDLVGRAILPSMRGRFFGAMQAFGGIIGICGGVAVGWIFAENRFQFPMRFAIVFALGSLAFLISVGCIALVYEPPEEFDHSNRPSLRREVHVLVADENIRRLFLAQILVGTLQLSLPFYVIYSQEQAHLSGEWVGVFIIAQTIGGTGAAMIWGWIAERYGSLVVIRLVAVLVMFTPVFALLARASAEFGSAMLLLVFAFTGAGFGGAKLGFWNYLLDLVKPHDRRLYLGLANTATSPILLMPLLGGMLAQWGGYVFLFTITAVCGLCALISTLALVDPRRLVLSAEVGVDTRHPLDGT